ncbi:MAG: ATP synthase F1 subunit delta [Bacteroidales bacterium]|nr:ATP synthase F1 subunit delta [Bacteroidales bacterium]MDT8430347.1 ATP synthase F1 subunit delta [Bacteroidales bacterium]
MNESKISVRYARALFESAKGKDLLDQTRRDMDTIQKVSHVKEFRILLLSPVIKQSQKQHMLEQVLSGQVGDLTFSLLKLLLSNGREEYIPAIARNYTELYKQHKGIVSATFTTAKPVSKELSDKVRKAVQDALKSSIEMATDDKEELIGGFVLRIEDEQYDASVARSLKKIKAQLLQ